MAMTGKALAFTAVGGMVAALSGCGAAEQPTATAADAQHAAKNCCAPGKNACKGKGFCKTAKNACRGMNACKGQGGCAPKDRSPDCPQ